MKVIISNMAWIEKDGFKEPAADVFVLKQQCTIIPKTSSFNEITKPIKMYRETDKYLGVPRHFYRKYNQFHKNKDMVEIVYDVSEGIPLTPNTNQIQLREYDQEPLVSTFVESLTAAEWGCGLMEAYTGFGKCQRKGSKILTFSGQVKNVEDVGVDDLLMGPDSKPRRVLNLVRGFGKMYKVSPIKGDAWYCNEDHILSLKVTQAASAAEDWLSKLSGQILNMTVKEYLTLAGWAKHRLKLWRTGVEFPSREIKTEPYFMGLWLGDGTRRRVQITNPEPEIRAYLKDFATEKDLILQEGVNTASNCPEYNITTPRGQNNPVWDDCKTCWKGDEKRIPEHYKINDREARLQLLAGLLDSDGHLVKETVYEIITKYDGLKDDVLFLARSLGFAAYATQKRATIKDLGFEGLYWRLCISGDTNEIPCRVLRKKAKPRKQIKNHLVTGFEIEQVEDDEYYGFNLDQDHLYLMDDFTVTHNSVITLEIINRLGGNALILVHSEALKDQWVEKVKEFYPNARIGEVQADVCDYKDKDIVIGMVQSIMNDNDKYPRDFYRYFRTLVVDEVHRMGSLEFGKAAPKFNSKYVFGMSGTIRRNDGCMNVFKWVLGDVIITADEQMRVKPIVYLRETGCPFPRQEWQEVNKSTGKVTSKVFDIDEANRALQLNHLAKQDARNKAIAADVIKALRVGRNPLVMSERKVILEKVSEYIDAFAKVDPKLNGKLISHGFYIGGKNKSTRKEELAAAARCDVVYATIQLAKEGIDIPRLDTLFMATPLGDVEQLIGRICRPTIKWENGKPVIMPREHESMVVDYIDSESSLFKALSYTRGAQYRRLGWEIIGKNF